MFHEIVSMSIKTFCQVGRGVVLRADRKRGRFEVVDGGNPRF